MLTLAMASACDDSDDVVEIGVIERVDIGIGAEIEVPSSVKIGELALVRVSTYGDGCISLDDTEVNITAGGAEITPYDRRHPPKCTSNFLVFKHEAQVRFNTLGLKTILVNGRSRDGLPGSEQVVQKTFTMTVVE
jgi:hypothetical protein